MTKIGYDLYLSDRVQELLEEGTLREIIKLVEDELRDEIFTTTPDDSSQREQIYHEMHALNRIQLKLIGIVDELKFAKQESY